MKKSRRKPGYVTHNRYELLLMNTKAIYSATPSTKLFFIFEKRNYQPFVHWPIRILLKRHIQKPNQMEPQ